MSTIRIELDGQEPNSCNCHSTRNITIDTSFPGALRPLVSESAWTSFCAGIDEALKPIGQTKRELRREGLTCLVTYIVLSNIIVGLVISKYLSWSNLSWQVLVFVGLPCALVLLAFHQAHDCLRKGMIDKAKENVRTLCRLESEKNPHVSFHLKEEEHLRRGYDDGRPYNYVARVSYYIECSVATTSPRRERNGRRSRSTRGGGRRSAEQAHHGTEQEIPVALAFPVSSNSTETVAQRLKELENIKELLTEEEYSSKRRDILQEL